jgi:tRNA nucleotidyltransferase/poly(A) polymerase
VVAADDLSVAEAEWFSRPETKVAFACLNSGGFEARAVGGAVRNALLGRGAVTEVDFATTATPEDVIKLAAEAGIKALPTGVAHGTVTLIVNGVPFEVTTLRRDVATDGRHATVAFGTDWAGDARRRDFTMNAIYADAAGKIYDPLGGLEDLRAGRVRFVGEPEARIREDYLRTLRFFRFSADYAREAFDSAGIAAAIRERGGLARLSRERVRMELLRILVARRAGEAIEIMEDGGLLLPLLGGVTRRLRFKRLCSIEAALGLVPGAVLRLAALAVFVKEDAVRLEEKLRLSTQEAKDLAAFAEMSPGLTGYASKPQLEVSLYKLGTRLYLGQLLMAWAASDAALDDPAWRFAAGLAVSWRQPVFPIGGADLIALGVMPGPAMGALLKDLEEQWATGGFSADRDTLLRVAQAKAPARRR